MSGLYIDEKSVKNRLIRFIYTQLSKRGFKRAVLGLSGGIDSALVAYLCREALGPKNVFAMILPYKTTAKKDIDDAHELAGILNINAAEIDITPMIDSYFSQKEIQKDISETQMGIRRGNKMARERMSILYDRAKALDALVLGTGNKTEILLGYFTRHGDAACDINPISTLYKTQVRQLASYMHIPDFVINKIPSAGLWPGQTDEDEMGFLYEDVDKVLHFMIDKKYSDRKLEHAGFNKDFIKKVKDRIAKYSYKSEQPAVYKG